MLFHGLGAVRVSENIHGRDGGADDSGLRHGPWARHKQKLCNAGAEGGGSCCQVQTASRSWRRRLRTRQAFAPVRLTTVHPTVRLVSLRRNSVTQSELLGLRLAFLGIPRKPALATTFRPVFSMHASLLPGADPGNVQLWIERVPRLHVPPLPKDVAVTERGATTRSWCVVRTTLPGICVVILAHPRSPEHHGTFVFSQIL